MFKDSATIKNPRKAFTEREHKFREAGWLVVDSGELTLEQTVAHILNSTVNKV